MKVGYIQFRPVFGRVEENIDILHRLIASVEADLLVLPELATSGYTFASREELARCSEPFDSSPSLDSLQAAARKRSCGIVAGFPERTGDRIFNSAALLCPDGTRKLYRKLHLFGAENLLFDPGDLPFSVHECNGAKLGILVCFDWYFPESVRTLALKGAQIICHPVNFVLPWGQRAMIIRSLENRVFSVTANRYGAETNGDRSFSFTGASQIVSPQGEVLASSPIEGDYAVVTNIDPATATDKHINRFNDLFANRRPEFYTELTENRARKE